jgi:TetR/AcrR family transcriptional regulator, regulator of mycofactocin system
MTEAPARRRPDDAPGSGRRRVTSRGELERIGLQLFCTLGFEETSLDDVAMAAGVGRRTLFRYFPSKNDIVWGEFDRELERFRAWFKSCPGDVPLTEALRLGVNDFNSFPAEVEPFHRRRMTLILNTPALQAHSTLRYAEWREVVAEFAAQRLNVPQDHLLPRLIGHMALAAGLSAYEQWLEERGGDLCSLLDQCFGSLATGLVSLV